MSPLGCHKHSTVTAARKAATSGSAPKTTVSFVFPSQCVSWSSKQFTAFAAFISLVGDFKQYRLQYWVVLINYSILFLWDPGVKIRSLWNRIHKVNFENLDGGSSTEMDVWLQQSGLSSLVLPAQSTPQLEGVREANSGAPFKKKAESKCSSRLDSF